MHYNKKHELYNALHQEILVVSCIIARNMSYIVSRKIICIMHYNKKHELYNALHQETLVVSCITARNKS